MDIDYKPSKYEQLEKLFQKLKDDYMKFWFHLQNMFRSIVKVMKIISPIGDDHNEGMKGEDFLIKKRKQKGIKEDKKNNVKVVDQPSKCFCNICLDFKAEPDMFRGGKCHDPFCIDCISNYVASKIQQNNLDVKCPIPSCSVEIKPEYLMSILPKDVIDRWESAKYESSIPLSQKFYCPFKNCSVLLVNDRKKGKPVTRSECPNCHRLFCAQCKIPWHAEMSCKEFHMLKANKDENYLDMKFLESAKANNWPKCPHCSFYVQRICGCEHMTCRCGCNFCYKCGAKWSFGHTCKNS